MLLRPSTLGEIITPTKNETYHAYSLSVVKSTFFILRGRGTSVVVTNAFFIWRGAGYKTSVVWRIVLHR